MASPRKPGAFAVGALENLPGTLMVDQCVFQRDGIPLFHSVLTHADEGSLRIEGIGDDFGQAIVVEGVGDDQSTASPQIFLKSSQDRLVFRSEGLGSRPVFRAWGWCQDRCAVGFLTQHSNSIAERSGRCQLA